MSLSVIETHKVDGLTVEIVYDPSPQSPREWSNLGIMACFHRRYDLGDKHAFRTPADLDAFFEAENAVKLPMYLYDHSGLTVSTSPFRCPWDSGQIGYIYATAETIRQEYGVKRITKKLRAKVEKILGQEVETYDHYLTGQVYGFVIKDEDGETLDSLWSIYDDPSMKYVLEEAFATAKVEAKHRSTERFKTASETFDSSALLFAGV